MQTLLATTKLPRAILHLDGDSFFASIEQNLNHTLKGKPIVTGAERGAATSISYEAKRCGVHRGMSLKEIKAVCPDIIVVPSDYTAYSIYAHRMYKIVRRFTPDVEEYSIDECFADITGLHRKYRMSYEKIALMIKETLETELGVTFGVGLAPNKVLAKIASKYRKPAGFTTIYGRTIHEFLPHIAIEDVWGIGRSTSFYLQKIGIRSAFDLATKPYEWLQQYALSKPFKEIWLELNGKFVKNISVTPAENIGSIIKSHTFTPPSTDHAFIFSQLSKNVEAACVKARRYKLLVREISFYLKTQSFTYQGYEVKLSVPTNDPISIIKEIERHFGHVYTAGTEYRASGITLRNLLPQDKLIYDLFGNIQAEQTKNSLLQSIDTINQKFGRGMVHLCASHTAVTQIKPIRKHHITRDKVLISVTKRRKTIDIPYLGIVR
jgi:DNA polymerase-4/DNA polymerase V